MSHHHHNGTAHSWRIDVRFDVDDDATEATAELMIDDEVYEASGAAHTLPIDASIARELCVARALSGLAHQLVDDATRKVGRTAQGAADAADDARAVYTSLDG